jgi:hypothetical protein
VQQTLFYFQIKTNSHIHRGVPWCFDSNSHCAVCIRGVQESLGSKDFWGAYNHGVSVLFPWCFHGVQESLGRKEFWWA